MNIKGSVFILLLLLPGIRLSAQTLSPVLGAKVTKLGVWQFAKEKPEGWATVAVPHSCNAADGCTASYFRGKSYYRHRLRLTGAQVAEPLFLLFEGAAQASSVYIGGTLVATHRGGYTPFVVRLNGHVKRGENEILVACDNSEDISMIPVSSDFNKNNGLHNPVFLLEMNDVYASPSAYGLYRMHVSTPLVTDSRAETEISTLIRNERRGDRRIGVRVTLTDMTGKTCYSSRQKLTVKAGDSIDYHRRFAISNPHLWNGIADPYLYRVSVIVTDGHGRRLDEMSTRVGYRYCRMDAARGFFLNGHAYPLRGVAVHQDWDRCASAVSDSLIDIDYQIIHELNANFLRLAHYPHNDYAYQKCDELGIVVQTEIPWVNVCGVDAPQSYFDNIHSQMREMITNLCNHPSIVFWGMWNELDFWGNNDKLQGKFDAARVVRETASLYDEAKSLDSSRFVGVSDCSCYQREGYAGLKCDYHSENRYNGWYSDGPFDDFARDVKDAHQRTGVFNVSEYGAGINPFCHSARPLQTTDRGVAGRRHDEEFGNLFHESYVRQIMAMPFLNFTSVWVMFDFPVASRLEGYADTADGLHFTESEERKYMNDKGLVTRDRKTRKDVFYLYKSLWNKKVTTVHITSSRFSIRPAGQPLQLKAYSNAQSLSLYQNGSLVEVMRGSGESTGVIWNFRPISFKTDCDTFCVVAQDGTRDTVKLRMEKEE